MFNVKLDRSYEEFDSLRLGRSPNWSQEQLFLKVIIQGKASLYYYEDGNFQRFFFSKENPIPSQLIYRRYLLKNNTVATNVDFRQQLLNEMKCDKMGITLVDNLNYRRDVLEKYFKKYNECSGEPFTIVNINDKTSINLKAVIGVNYSLMSIANRVSNYSVDFENTTSFRFGFEVEYVLPVNTNRWGVILEPTYQGFNSKKQSDAVINYGFVEFPIGLRHYFTPHKNIGLYLDLFYISNFVITTNSKLIANNYLLTIRPRNSFVVGVGYATNRLSMELRYYTERNLLSDYDYWSCNFTRFSLIIGYRLFTGGK